MMRSGPERAEAIEDTNRRGRDNEIASLEQQLQKIILTPANLQALFRLCNEPNNSRIRSCCPALCLLRDIGGIASAYDVRIPNSSTPRGGAKTNHGEQNAACSFGQMQIWTMANVSLVSSSLSLTSSSAAVCTFDLSSPALPLLPSPSCQPKNLVQLTLSRRHVNPRIWST